MTATDARPKTKEIIREKAMPRGKFAPARFYLMEYTYPNGRKTYWVHGDGWASGFGTHFDTASSFFNDLR